MTIKTRKKLNKMICGGMRRNVMSGSVVIGGWHWYTNKNSRNKN